VSYPINAKIFQVPANVGVLSGIV